ncbi:MAG: hypothetical protein KDD44_09270, partial [Bdellovibrionales bacterium]|nr:hypothetical protein [Bdellovibrionales bacterium]
MTHFDRDQLVSVTGFHGVYRVVGGPDRKNRYLVRRGTLALWVDGERLSMKAHEAATKHAAKAPSRPVT